VVSTIPVARFSSMLFAVCVLSVSALSLADPQEKALYNFLGAPDGAYPVSNVISDSNGLLYAQHSPEEQGSAAHQDAVRFLN